MPTPTIVFNGISLNPNMVWLERHQSRTVAQSIRRTLGARPVIFVGQLLKGVPITLEAAETYGWLKKAVVDELLVLADDPTGTYTLSFGGENILVMFRHVDEPAVEMRPFVPRVLHESGDYFIGQIKLITV
jgi:hypothetical protein